MHSSSRATKMKNRQNSTRIDIPNFGTFLRVMTDISVFNKHHLQLQKWVTLTAYSTFTGRTRSARGQAHYWLIYSPIKPIKNLHLTIETYHQPISSTCPTHTLWHLQGLWNISIRSVAFIYGFTLCIVTFYLKLLPVGLQSCCTRYRFLLVCFSMWTCTRFQKHMYFLWILDSNMLITLLLHKASNLIMHHNSIKICDALCLNENHSNDTQNHPVYGQSHLFYIIIISWTLTPTQIRARSPNLMKHHSRLSKSVTALYLIETHSNDTKIHSGDV